jgi:Terminase small subunit
VAVAEKLKPLNAQQRRFVDEYLIDFSARAAAVRAGYSSKDSNCSNRLMQIPRIADEINARCLKIQAKLAVDANDVRRGFARIATDPREEAAGGPSWGDRIAAWRELGKLFGMYTNKIQVTGTLTLVDLLLAADAKAKVEHNEAVH